MIKGKKNRKAFIEEISGLQNIIANFSSSDQHYANGINRLIDYAQSNQKEKKSEKIKKENYNNLELEENIDILN